MTSNPKNAPSQSGFIATLSTPVSVIFLLTIVVLIFVSNTRDLLSFANFHEELRGLHHYDSERVNFKDYAGQYLSKSPRPLLYDQITQLALSVGVDLVLFHKLLSLLCGMLLIAGGALAGWRVGGALAAVAVATLIVAQPIYQFQINSAVPHAFALPLLMWGLVFLLYGRPYMLAGLTLLAGLLYTPLVVVLGLCLASYLVINRRCLSSGNRNRFADILVLTVTGLISATLLWLQLQQATGYGESVGIGTMVDSYPENGPGGRHFVGVFQPTLYVFSAIYRDFQPTLHPELRLLLLEFLGGMALIGLLSLRSRVSIYNVILGFILPCLLIYLLVLALRPVVAYRFLLYPMLVILPVLFVVGVTSLVGSFPSNIRDSPLVITVIIATFVLSLASTDKKLNGFTMRLDEPSIKLIDFVQELPKDSLLAAWPAGAQTDLIPYLTGRPLLVTYKAHYPSHKEHIVNMRERMFDLIDAYLAQDIQALIHLNCKWQVGYMVVNRLHFNDDGKSLHYFAPFNDRIQDITSQKAEFILLQPPSAFVVFEAGRFTVIDIGAMAMATASGCS